MNDFAVVCHDAGGANVLFAWMARNSRIKFRVFLGGPAKRIWDHRPGVGILATTLEECLSGAECLITTTGWASDLEYNALKFARGAKIRSVALLDHWVNYRERFSRDSIEILPDEIWVSDEIALNIATNAFPEMTIRLIDNHYMADQLSRINPITSVRDPYVLYVLEPIRSEWGRGAPGEYQALDFFVAQSEKLKIPFDSRIILRPHPSEALDKYDAWISSQHSRRYSVDNSCDVAEAISGAAWVVGCESYALVIAMRAKRSVFCSLPTWAPKSRLPFKELVNIADLS